MSERQSDTLGPGLHRLVASMRGDVAEGVAASAPKRTQVALTAQQWTAIVVAACHGSNEIMARGVEACKTREAEHLLAQLSSALQIIDDRMKAEADRE